VVTLALSDPKAKKATRVNVENPALAAAGRALSDLLDPKVRRATVEMLDHRVKLESEAKLDHRAIRELQAQKVRKVNVGLRGLWVLAGYKAYRA
jgi:hypothetical protein